MGETKMMILDFYSEYCAPCKVLTRDLDDLTKENNLNVQKINIMDKYELTEKYNITSVPTLLILKDDAPGNRYTGYKGKEDLVRFLSENGLLTST